MKSGHQIIGLPTGRVKSYETICILNSSRRCPNLAYKYEYENSVLSRQSSHIVHCLDNTDFHETFSVARSRAMESLSWITELCVKLTCIGGLCRFARSMSTQNLEIILLTENEPNCFIGNLLKYHLFLTPKVDCTFANLWKHSFSWYTIIMAWWSNFMTVVRPL